MASRRSIHSFAAPLAACWCYLLLVAAPYAYGSHRNKVNLPETQKSQAEVNGAGGAVKIHQWVNWQPQAFSAGHKTRKLMTSADATAESANKCIVDIQKRVLREFAPYLDGFQGRVLLFDVATHTNMGDSILWLGAKRLLEYYGRTPDIICGMTQNPDTQFPVCPTPKQLIKQAAGQPVLILWQAGGNYGDIWPWAQKGRISYIRQLDQAAAEMDANITIVQLPQSVYYASPENAAKDSLVLTGLKAVRYILYSRSMLSHNVVLQQLSNDTQFARYIPDFAFMCGPQHHIKEPAVDILFLLRDDKESAFEGSERYQLAKQLLPANVTHKVTDWAAGHKALGGAWTQRHSITADLSDIRMQEAMQILGQGKVVVTNRLHALVTAALMHQPAFWFEAKGMPGYNKLTSTRDLAFESSAWCTDENMLSFPYSAASELESFSMATKAAVKYLMQGNTHTLSFSDD